MRFDRDNIIYGVLIIVICVLLYRVHSISVKSEQQIAEIEHYNESEGLYTKLYYDQTIESLKNENKSLYDSLKQYKEEIDYLIQFKYQKEFSTGKIDVKKDTVENNNEEIKTFEYSNLKNDTLNYNLKIGSTVEPNWYSLDFALSDNFTIVNKKIGDVNEINIKTDNGGLIDNTTIVKKKEKYSFIDNIAIGPSVTCGYDFAKKEPEFIVGFSITYDISNLLKKKK